MMSHTKVRVSDPTASLKEDHRKVKGLFQQYEKLAKGDKAKKARIFREIHQELFIHTTIEEKIFYPAFRSLGTEEARDLVGESLEEHHVVKILLEELSSMRAGEEQYDSKMTVLSENVLHHAEEEEEDMFPKMKKLPEDQRDDLATNMELMRERLKRDSDR
jgi:hemerythrin superfamily protein